MNRPILLLIRDGWGIGDGGAGDAVAAADTPHMDRLLEAYPTCTLSAAGRAVGVRDGSQGSSEVGHLNMGAGRIVKQEVVRVDEAIEDGSLFATPLYTQAVEHCKATGAAFHLMGLVQDQGVHATQDHLFAFLEDFAAKGVERIFVHFFSDGRDTPPRSALSYLDALEGVIARVGKGQVASVIGRYWAMDRAENWQRTGAAFDCLTKGQAEFTAASARQAIEDAYTRADEQKAASEDIVETDEFIRPTLIVDDDGQPIGTIQPGDAVLHFNYRQDRAIQLSKAFVEDDFTAFERGPRPDVRYMGLTKYYDEFPSPLIPPMNMANLLSDILSRNGLTQLRIAEFQKYKHVTSFFNGKKLQPDPGEDCIQVDSITIPEDQQPEMSAPQVTELVLTAVRDGMAAVRQAAEQRSDTHYEGQDLPGLDPARLDETYDVIVLNYANGDMVGHTGVFDAARRAIEAVDQALGQVVPAVLDRGGAVLITSDHGNSEQMLDESGATQTAHTTRDVTFTLVSEELASAALRDHGVLADIAPTILQLLQIDQPEDMTAESLLAK
jgi:2,3-bisphosphoglycerate-independent phosphoglycerate mutase